MNFLDVFTRTFRTLPGWQWLVLFAIPPLIILLYFLKLKRRPLEVPSTYLWHRTIEDLHVNSLWQKLRQNLLMYLQLLIVLLAILACLNPTWQGGQLSQDRYIFLVDTSASMSSTDVDPTRLAVAKKRLVTAIDQLKPDSAAMIVSFSDRAIVEQPFTTNRRLLKRRVRAIQPTQQSTDLDEALRVAAGLANPGRTASDETDVAAADALPATLVIYSDGRFRNPAQFAMGNLNPVYVPIGNADAENVGIVSFNIDSSPERPDKLQAFGRVQNFGSTSQEVVVRLTTLDPEPRFWDAAELKLPAGAVGGVEFVIDAIDSGEVRLELDHRDALSSDNTAYAAVNDRRRAKVLLLTPGNDAMNVVLTTSFIRELADVRIEDVNFLDSYDYREVANAADLVIYDQCQPDEMPLTNTYFLGALPPDESWIADTAVQLPQIIDTDQSHPLMRFVEMGDVMWIVDAQPIEVPRGGTILIDSHVGPLLVIAPRRGYEDLVQAFPIMTSDDAGNRFANTDWTIRVSFPVFMGNVLTYLAENSLQSDANVTSPGDVVELDVSHNVKQITVRAPGADEFVLKRDTDDTFAFHHTNELGVYQVFASEDGGVEQRFAVNLFDDVESNIGPADMVITQYEDIAARRVLETKPIKIWKYLLGLSLVMLVAEWYVYNRRVYI